MIFFKVIFKLLVNSLDNVYGPKVSSSANLLQIQKVLHFIYNCGLNYILNLVRNLM